MVFGSFADVVVLSALWSSFSKVMGSSWKSSGDKKESPLFKIDAPA